MAVVSSVVVPYASYLRVYEPLAAFPEPERGHWYRYARREALPGAQDELRLSLGGLTGTPPQGVPAHESEDAFVAVVDGVTCVCPWRTRLRAWLALRELEAELPEAVLAAALPRVLREQAAADYDRWRRENPDARPWIRTSVWVVPVRWFVLFADEEREYAPGGPSAAVFRYRTPMAQARRRVARGLRALRDASREAVAAGEPGPHEPLIDGLTDVGRWLEEFHPRSLVELDYGGLVHALPKEHLEGDHSAADVAEGLTALAAGDGERAGAAYRRLTDRWGRVRDRQFAS
ncbi:hypothetical protein SRB5_48070 [Streptomyces sp. RB5]|uniref:DUF8083 domain-containing protein n=1 Tax=Streptomyces smaragdinus TaxID=2585196 RepID=A0A7K0CMC9_9ACTN|nr:hypothetical protein [Streptomyces smaragdinus]MQY14635.1 hypothetical protein [Streptomyces smaragdinus]